MSAGLPFFLKLSIFSSPLWPLERSYSSTCFLLTSYVQHPHMKEIPMPATFHLAKESRHRVIYLCNIRTDGTILLETSNPACLLTTTWQLHARKSLWTLIHQITDLKELCLGRTLTKAWSFLSFYYWWNSSVLCEVKWPKHSFLQAVVVSCLSLQHNCHKAFERRKGLFWLLLLDLFFDLL